MESVIEAETPDATDTDDGLILTLAVPAADAVVPGKTTPNIATRVKLTSPATDVLTPRRQLRNRPRLAPLPRCRRCPRVAARPWRGRQGLDIRRSW
jgi:hypothetical protein